MADQVQCEVKKGRRRCPTLFSPGVTGGRGKEGLNKCAMHLARERRGASNADEPEKVRDGSRSATITVYCSAAFAERVAAVRKARGLPSSSAWALEVLEPALQRQEAALATMKKSARASRVHA